MKLIRNFLGGATSIAIAGIIACTNPALAQTDDPVPPQVTIVLTGEVSYIYPEDWTTFEMGDSMQLVYTFDTTVMDSEPSEDFGAYQDAVIGIQYRVGSYLAHQASGTAASIIVINSEPFTRGIVAGDAYIIEDVYLESLTGSVVPNVYQQRILNMNSPRDGTVFTDDSLPTSADDLAGFLDSSDGDIAYLTMSFEDTTNPDFHGTVIADSLTLLSAGTPEEVAVEVIEDLIEDVMDLNLQQGISNAFDSKLDAALHLLDDFNTNNDGAVLNTLQAFINAVEAQRGNKLTDEQADELIAAANLLISVLTE